MKIDGKKIAKNILDELKKQVEKLKKKNTTPHLAIILVGDNSASITYVNQKKIKAEQIGANTTIIRSPNDVSESELIKIVKQFNQNKTIHGIIVQQPLPQNINTETITQTIDPKKDVDGFNQQSKFAMPISLAILEVLRNIYNTEGVAKEEGLPTARTVKEHWREGLLLTGPRDWLESKQIAIIGKGETGGKPIIQALQELKIKPKVIDSKTLNPELITKTADIIISAVGKTNIIRPEMIKKNVILIGVGQHKENGEIIGDYDEEKIKDIASFYTPTPGGVGPIDVTMLLKNLITSAEDQGI
jgi:methylenetetrahydrofolate dehydrogenase (NADP+) / methenyltetrahydrofolate cyclohydrolase